VEQGTVDLRKEQQTSRARPRYGYSAMARFFFRSMDMLAGSETTLAKAKLVEALAPVPYRSWENLEYSRMRRHHGDQELVEQARAIMNWGREAKDNEYMHLLVINEKLKEDAARDPRYMTPPLPTLMVGSYIPMTWTMARIAIHRALLLNAEFEDHAEHYYAQLVDEHPEWEDEPVTSERVQEYGSFRSWADVFRRVGLDERDHMNDSFAFAGRPEHIVEYEGMPVVQGAGSPA
jgi:ubiquinol oxidase